MLHLGAVGLSAERRRDDGQQHSQAGSGQSPQDESRQPEGARSGHSPQNTSGQPPRRGGPPGGPSQSSGGQPPRDDSGVSRRTVIAGVGVLGVGAAGAWFLLSDDEEGVRDTLRKQERALENDNLDGYMDTMHPESPVYDSTKRSTRQLMDRYDMDLDLTIDSVTIDDDTADAEVTQVTRVEQSSSDFPIESEMTHELRTHDGEWKVYSSTITSRSRI
jgi:hypothetical protein